MSLSKSRQFSNPEIRCRSRATGKSRGRLFAGSNPLSLEIVLSMANEFILIAQTRSYLLPGTSLLIIEPILQDMAALSIPQTVLRFLRGQQ
jgi:hypothetical protein